MLQPPKKKLSKKEKARLEAEAAESARLEMERERLRKIEEEKDRQVREKREAEKRQYQEVIEHKQRKQQLKHSIEYLLKLKQQSKGIRRQEKTEREVKSRNKHYIVVFFTHENDLLLLADKLLHVTCCIRYGLDIVDSIHALHWAT